ncbi:hypothetical protein [uncultured Tateyamaria sp.]|nr:hypothetical protein [uncultured Tateyamaria sp.]
MTRFNTGYRNKTGMLFNSGTRNIMGNGKITGVEINTGKRYVIGKRNKTG